MASTLDCRFEVIGCVTQEIVGKIIPSKEAGKYETTLSSLEPVLRLPVKHPTGPAAKLMLTSGP